MAKIEITDKISWRQKALKAVAWLVGASVGYYSGIHLLIPLGITLAVWCIGKKLLRVEKQLYLPAIAVQTGSLLWFLFGLLYLGAFNSGLIDIGVLVLGLTWLVLKPGFGPILFLTLYQVVGLAGNAVSFAEAAIRTTSHKALLVHIIWRLMALFSHVDCLCAVAKGCSN